MTDHAWLCIALPRLALDLIDRACVGGEPCGSGLRPRSEVFPEAEASRTKAAPTGMPRVVIDGPEQRAEIHLADAVAAAHGVRPGQRLAAAQALAPALTIHRRDRLAERQALERLACWAYRYTSRVSLDGHDALLLELAGSSKLFGGQAALQTALQNDLDTLGFLALFGYGATPAAARLRAEVARRDPARSGQLYLLAPIALSDSALDSRTVATLQATGIRTLGELAKLPRSGIARRFGQGTLDYLGRLRGELPEALELYRPPDSYHAWLELPAPCASTEALAFPLKRMLGDLAAVLSARDGGVQHFMLRFALESARRSSELRSSIGDLCRLEVGLIEASRDPEHLYTLTRARLERMRFPRPVLGIHLEVARLPTFVPRHQDLFGEVGDSAQGLNTLIERLSARLGDAALLRPQWIADHRPERASRWRPSAEGPALLRPPEGTPPYAARPNHLLPDPLPIDIAGVVLISSAERIESGWWDDGDVRRDYYLAEIVDVQRLYAGSRQALNASVSMAAAGGASAREQFQLSVGARAWVYQDLRQPECWYLQGWFG
ncbi:MAG: DNA polymerase Y family protein [Lysobacterales bacterium]|nr:DNA polymerase Y family protein [Xanthomonadales bacterium]